MTTYERSISLAHGVLRVREYYEKRGINPPYMGCPNFYIVKPLKSDNKEEILPINKETLNYVKEYNIYSDNYTLIKVDGITLAHQSHIVVSTLTGYIIWADYRKSFENSIKDRVCSFGRFAYNCISEAEEVWRFSKAPIHYFDKD